MKSLIEHATHQQLQQLIFGDENSDQCEHIASHVENCEHCQAKLDSLSGSISFDTDAREMLSDIQIDETNDRHGDRATPIDINAYLNPATHPELLGRIGRYDIERFIGAGGMGVVFKGYDSELNRPVAIKVLGRHLSHSGAAQKRFAREAKSIAAVVHEHVVAIHNVEYNESTPFLVMQFVSGESLQARVDRDGPLNVKEILRIGSQAAAGLHAAHQQGVIHRDIKPGNILLEQQVERALVTDFGLAQTIDDASMTQSGLVTGTPNYMSPEQASGQSTDLRSDLFSLGAVLYFMATGRAPFRAEKAMAVMHRICNATHTPAWQINPDITDELSDTIDRLLQKKPGRRFNSAEEVENVLRKQLSKLQSHKPSRLRQVRRFARANSNFIFWIALPLALLLAAWGGFAVYPMLQSRPNDNEQSSSVSDDSMAPNESSLLDQQEKQNWDSGIQSLHQELDNIEDFDDAFDQQNQ